LKDKIVNKKIALFYSLLILVSTITKTSGEVRSNYNFRERRPEPVIVVATIPQAAEIEPEWYEQRSMLAAGMHRPEDSRRELAIAEQARRALATRNKKALTKLTQSTYFKNVYLGLGNAHNVDSSLASRVITTFNDNDATEILQPLFGPRGNMKINSAISPTATPLTHAMTYRRTKLAQSLLDLKADPFVRIGGGKDAFETFCCYPNRHLIRHLAREARNRGGHKVASALATLKGYGQKSEVQKLIRELERKVESPRSVSELLAAYKKASRRKRKPTPLPKATTAKKILTVTAFPSSETPEQKKLRVSKEKERKDLEAWRIKTLAEIKAKHPEKFKP
jgi:hypothetical protein